MSANPYQSPEADGPRPEAARPRVGCLVKSLAAVAVIGLIIALLLPATRTSREAARRAQCTNNLRQIAIALRDYESVYHCLPPAYTVDAEGRPLHSWRTLILPFMEEKALYDTIDLAKPWDDPANKEAYETTLPAYQCPSADSLPGHTTYLAIVGTGNCFRPTGPRRLAEIADGPGSTLMVIEVESERKVHWMSPKDISEQSILSRDTLAMEPHWGGAEAAFADGHVHFLSSETEATVLRALISIDGDDNEALREGY